MSATLGGEHFKFEDIVHEIETDALEAARRLRGGHGNSFRKKDDSLRSRAYEIVACGVAFAYELSDSPKLLAEILKDDLWKDRKNKLDEKDILRIAMRYLLNAPSSGSIYSRACDYANAVQHLFDSKVEALKIPDEIREAGGIDKLLSEARSCSSTRITAPAVDKTEEGRRGHKALLPTNKVMSSKSSEGMPAGNAELSKSVSHRPRALQPMPRFNSTKHLLIEAENLMDCVFSNAAVEMLTLTVAVDCSKGGFVEMRLVNVAPS